MGSDSKKDEKKDDKKKEEKKPQTTVLKLHFHCENCVKRVKKAVATLNGVQSFSVDEKAGKVTVVGFVEPKKVLKKVKRTGKYVEMLEPKEKKDEKKSDDKKSDDKKKDEKKSEDKKSDDKSKDGKKSESSSDYVITRIAHNDFTYVFSDDNPNSNCSIM